MLSTLALPIIRTSCFSSSLTFGADPLVWDRYLQWDQTSFIDNTELKCIKSYQRVEEKHGSLFIWDVEIHFVCDAFCLIPPPPKYWCGMKHLTGKNVIVRISKNFKVGNSTPKHPKLHFNIECWKGFEEILKTLATITFCVSQGQERVLSSMPVCNASLLEDQLPHKPPTSINFLGTHANAEVPVGQ